MGIDKINSISALADILKSQVAKSASKNRAATSARGGKAQTHKKSSIKELDALIINKINRLHSEGEQFHAKSIRIIVESVLVWEFGEEIVNDPELEGLVNKITTNIHSSEKLTVLYNEYCANHR